MLQIKNLNLTHKKDLRVILSEFNLVLNKGDKAVIIGEEGNGKSTLMKWIYNPLLIDNYIEAEGERSEKKYSVIFHRKYLKKIKKKLFMSSFLQKKCFGIEHRKSYLKLPENSE